jgi:glycosyltransferase involved in cell wall biosynthesis
MGYANTMLARYLARLGVDVHYIAADLPIYHQNRDARSVYGQFSANRTMKPGESERYEGYTVHCVGHRNVLGVPMFANLVGKLRELRPDVVQQFILAGWAPLQTVAAKLALGFSLFSAAHTTVSAFPLARRKLHPWDRAWLVNMATRAIPGRVTSLFTERCYAATRDCAEVAERFYGIPHAKIVVVPLGVDTENFHLMRTAAERERREQLRRELGFNTTDIVCIYTGQFTDIKNPLVLGRAVDRLQASGLPVRGLFIGSGPQSEQLAACRGCVQLPFMPHRELPPYYRAAEIGVWPTQESMSMLDAAACGLPIIVNDTLLATERIDGNGITYRLNDATDLAEKIALLRDPAYRQQLGSVGARRMVELFSWDALARQRIAEYEAVLASRRQVA